MRLIRFSSSRTFPGKGWDAKLLSSFAEVVSLGYTRFLDFQKLEEQNRQLSVDRSLERIRAEVKQ